MRKSIVIPVIIVVVIIAVVAAVLNWPRDQNGEVPTAVKLGATLPVTGIFAGFGQQGWGMQKAVDDWNETYGGMYLSEWEVTVPVTLTIKDNQSDSTQVGPQSTELVLTNGVHALLSPNAPCDLHDPTTSVANDNDIPQIIPGGPFEPWYFGSQGGEAPDYTWFSGFAIGEPQPAPRNVPGYTMVDTWFMFMDEVDAKTETNGIVGVFASSDSDGTGWYEAFPTLLTNEGYTVANVTGLFPIEPMPDFTDMVHQWQAANVTILWGNCPGAHFGNLWSTCYAEGFRPKICLAARAALFPVDVESWGTTPPLGWGVGSEIWWSPHYAVEDGFVGIGNRTATSLADDWYDEKDAPLNRAIGSGYLAAQIMLNAIYEAGDVDGGAINAALADTNVNTIKGWVNFDPVTHFSAQPLSFGQWFYDDENEDEPFTLYVTASALDIIPEEEEPIFPLDTLYP
jgi:ABC-type branched-subunit amino acid transport system substrate-binding protein